MSEAEFEKEEKTVETDAEDAFDPVCVDLPRIYDSCGAKECLRDLTVYFTAEDQELIDNATAVRVTKSGVLTSTVNVDSIAFHRGYYSVDVVFYFAVCAEVYTGTGALPTTVTGLATYAKRVVLFGSEGNAKTFSSVGEQPIDASEFTCCPGCPSTLPEATVQVSCPMSLAASLAPVTTPVILPFIPESVAEFFGAELTAPATQRVLVTLGVFTIVQLTRSVQLMIPSYDFCVPRKECNDSADDPCEAFGKIDFPTDSFFPPSATDSSADRPGFGCGCE